MVVRNSYPAVPHCHAFCVRGAVHACAVVGSHRSPRRLRPRRQIMSDQRWLESARARLVGSSIDITARLGDRLLRIGRDLDQIVTEEAAALMRPQTRVQAVAREK